MKRTNRYQKCHKVYNYEVQQHELQKYETEFMLSSNESDEPK